MNQLISSIQNATNKTTTTNGMKAFKSTTDNCVDLFFKIGASRGKNIIPEFAKAYADEADIALRIALWARDVRGGAGERQLFRDILKYLAVNDYTTALRVLPKVPEVGRWDDLLELVDSPVESEAFDLISVALQHDKNGLCAKWMPRKGPVAEKLRKYLGFTPKQYRKTLVGLTQVVETKMCANQWTEIEYGKVPSLAAARYQKAFGRHDAAGYAAYVNKLATGEAKINASAVYPYDVLKSLRTGNVAVANAQWNSLPDYVGEQKFLPVVDVSGSMACSAGGSSMTCMDVAISLGLYLSERNKSSFKDAFITFSERPQLQLLKGTLNDRYEQLRRADWGYNTNLEAVFDLILNNAVKHKVSASDMPDYVVILSDMQFDRADSGKTAFGMVKEKYKKAGYDMPVLVFWNLHDHDNVPVKADKSGAILVSGFSPSLMQSLLTGKTVTPRDQMLATVMNPRYDV